MERRVGVVLITFDSAPWLASSLDALEQQAGVTIRLVVIDNASSDESVTLVRKAWPEAEIICNETNRGFAAAANQGVGRLDTEFILLLNPDVRLAPDYLMRVIDAMEATGSEVGTAAGTLLQGFGATIEPTGLIDSRGIRMTRSGRHFDIDHGTSGERISRETEEVFGVSGAAAVLRRSFIEDVSIDGELFDERFFAYREDADLAWRGRIFGWRSLHVPEAEAWHVRRVTPAARRSLPAFINMHGVKNRFLLRFNNQGMYLTMRNLPHQFTRDLVVLGGVLLMERASFPAFQWLWRNRHGMMARRRIVQRRRRLSDRAIARWFG